MRPLVSVIIPVYNAEKYLDSCILSVIGQTWPNIEIILVDDGSTDNSLNIIEKYKEAGTVKAIQQKNKGAAAARNAGLKQAKGIYIQFLDADDLLSPDKIEAQVGCLDGSLTHLAICKTVHFTEGENNIGNNEGDEWLHHDSNNPVDFLIKLYAGKEVLPGYGGMITVHAWLTPRELIDKAGLWNEDLRLDDDGEFFCRVVLASEGIKFSEKGLNYYRKFTDTQSLSAQKTRKGIESTILSTDLKLAHLKEKTADTLVDRIFARHYWWTGVVAYPQFKDLSAYCIQKAKQLGYRGEKYVGGPAGHILAGLFGWKVVRLMAWYRQIFKRSWA
ncbi:MAG TPA: glycosyltransferase [Mucilaginibacter sp.]|jgi:glycosyltransferase involved in cell wall biosynthesis|nr:glycosyltransferase [Mucilaginibacter sp.]